MNAEQYGLVSARRIATNNLVWQTPTLATAAQAFLLAAAFNTQSKPLTANILFAFSMFVGLASIQLMARHRYHEVVDSKLLEKFERDNFEKGYAVLHGREPDQIGTKPSFLARTKSYRLWQVVLLGFCLVAIFGLASRL